MHQSGKTVSKIHKSAVRLKAFHGSLRHKSRLYVGNFIFSFFFRFFSQYLFGGKDKFFILFIQIDNLNLYMPVQIFLCILHITQRQFRRRNKSSHTLYIGDDSFIGNPFYHNVKDLSGIFVFLQFIPGKDIGSLHTGKKDISVSVVFAHYCRRYLVSRMYFFFQIESRFPAVILSRDHSFRIIFKIKDHFFFVDTYYSPCKNISFFYFFHGLLQFFFIIFHSFSHNIPLLLFLYSLKK